MITVEGQSHGWYLICPFCKEYKQLESDTCKCGATVKVMWEKDDIISPELMLVR